MFNRGKKKTEVSVGEVEKIYEMRMSEKEYNAILESLINGCDRSLEKFFENFAPCSREEQKERREDIKVATEGCRLFSGSKELPNFKKIDHLFGEENSFAEEDEIEIKEIVKPATRILTMPEENFQFVRDNLLKRCKGNKKTLEFLMHRKRRYATKGMNSFFDKEGFGGFNWVDRDIETVEKNLATSLEVFYKFCGEDFNEIRDN